MATTLVIVESPAKARTIKKYLGAGYEVLASNGHVKDLPKKLGVDVEHDFLETYETIAGKAKVVAKLKSAAQKADHVLLATDPDREGEAIAFHIAQEIDGGGRGVDRVEFHEITRRGIEHGVRHPRRLDTNLYDAQRARRVLDRIVGYDVSALVWSKLAYGLSAGRVQSVALRLIVDRESEIDAFVPREYWSIGAALSHEGGRPLGAKLVSADGEKIDLGDAGVAGAVSADLERATFQVQKITRREQRRRPPAPYTTSKLQQDASSYLHLPARRTMRVAQSLYEGCDLKQAGGPVGLITYIRTDSTRVADEAVREVRAYIEKVFGAGSLPEQAWIYKSKKSAQDAHEAIRPTHVDLHPDAVRRYLTSDQYRLYKLVWTRFVASQMAAAVYDQTSIDIEARPGVAERRRERYLLRATGRILKSPGWLQVTGGQIQFAGEGENGHDEGREEQPDGLTSEPPSGPPSEPPVSIGSQLAQLRAAALCGRNETLPGLPDGALLDPVRPPGVVAEQKFTQPPPRYNEGSLVRELEKRGIGRPSTYAEIIGKVQARDYVRKLDGGAFQPSELGRLVVGGLVRSQLDFMDPGFTAEMEEELDEVGAGRLGRAELLRRFYHRFKEQLDRSKQQAAWKPAPEETSESCEECGAPMLKRWSKNGWFLGCTGYPKCKSTRPLPGERRSLVPAPAGETSVVCEKCGKPMVIRSGRYGEFLACSGYPKCKNARPVPLGVACPKCGGDLVEIRSRKPGGRRFYGCANYAAEQKCDFRLWARPVPVPCPVCGTPFMTERKGKSPALVCADKKCGGRRANEAGGGEPRIAEAAAPTESPS